MIHGISRSEDEKRRFSLVGGFLGAGKTTLIGKLTQWLQMRGLQVALVTNDQGQGLLDTVSAQAHLERGSVAEVTGGCFCCHLDELVGAISKLEVEARPNIVVAEPVGSCTDLMATVIRPMEQIYESPLTISPLSVILDARRALASLGGRRNKRDFHRDVGYIYRKQIEEAEWLVVNKSDLLAEEDLADLLARINREYSNKRIFVLSAKTGEGLEKWFEALLQSETSGGQAMEVDYQRYAEGEALLGWVNSEAVCEACTELDWERWLSTLGRRVGDLLAEGGHEVGHLKMSVTAEGRRYRVHQVMGGEEIESLNTLSAASKGDGGAPQLLINLRAEGEAKALEALITSAIQEQKNVKVTFVHQAAFQPGAPVPIHRIPAV